MLTKISDHVLSHIGRSHHILSNLSLIIEVQVVSSVPEAFKTGFLQGKGTKVKTLDVMAPLPQLAL